MNNNYGLSAYIGRTVQGGGFPVFVDPHYASQQNLPTVTLITGKPGSGKTFYLTLLVAYSTIFNKLNFVIDPKGDTIALKKLEERGYLKNVRYWNLFDDVDNQQISADKAGMLDPFRISKDINICVSRVKEVITMLVPSVKEELWAYLTPIIQDTAKESPTMNSFLNKLEREQDDRLRAVGSQLRSIVSLPMGQIICSRAKKQSVFEIKEMRGTIIANLLGIKLPHPDIKPDQYNDENKLSLVIMNLLSSVVSDTMLSLGTDIMKSIFIDEAWAVASVPTTVSLLKSVSLLGRSRNMALILSTQDLGHLKELEIGSTVSSMFAFATSDAEARLITRQMNLPQELEYHQELTAMGTGFCLMKDCHQRTGFVHIEAPKSWIEMFITKPKPKEKKGDDVNYE